MYYVYFLRSQKDPSKKYIGFTRNLKYRLESHNSGASIHSSKFRPWRLVTYIAFDTKEKATAFEKYIKIGSGFAFAQKRFW